VEVKYTVEILETKSMCNIKF